MFNQFNLSKKPRLMAIKEGDEMVVETDGNDLISKIEIKGRKVLDISKGGEWVRREPVSAPFKPLPYFEKYQMAFENKLEAALEQEKKVTRSISCFTFDSEGPLPESKEKVRIIPNVDHSMIACMEIDNSGQESKEPSKPYLYENKKEELERIRGNMQYPGCMW